MEITPLPILVIWAIVVLALLLSLIVLLKVWQNTKNASSQHRNIILLLIFFTFFMELYAVTRISGDAFHIFEGVHEIFQLIAFIIIGIFVSYEIKLWGF